MSTRYYNEHPDGPQPSVTTITGMLDKPALTYWAAGCATYYLREVLLGRKGHVTRAQLGEALELAKKEWRNVSQAACDIGTSVHDLCEEWAKTGTIVACPKDESIENGWNAFCDFVSQNNMVTHAAEVVVYGPGYGGRVDWVGELNGAMTLIDFKTSKGFYPEYAYQTAAYRGGELQGVTLPTPIVQSGCLRLDKLTGVPDLKIYATFEEDLLSFLALKDAWHQLYKKRVARHVKKLK